MLIALVPVTTNVIRTQVHFSVSISISASFNTCYDRLDLAKVLGMSSRINSDEKQNHT